MIVVDDIASCASRRVLVVEDTEAFRAFLLRALEVFGCTARGVSEVGDVLPAVISFEPEIVILDWNLSSGPAEGLLAELRKLRMKVIIVTGDPDGVGVDDVLVLGKPVHLARLKDAIESL